MAIRKKIVLLIVEGEADEAALAPLIKEIVKKEDILVKLCEGDLTSKIYTTREQNVVSEVGRKVNEFITFNKIKKADIVQVVLEDKRKVDKADDFADFYLKDIDGFVAFMNDKNLIFKGDFRETWRQIKLEKNSLMRHSNLHIFINEYVE